MPLEPAFKLHCFFYPEIIRNSQEGVLLWKKRSEIFYERKFEEFYNQ